MSRTKCSRNHAANKSEKVESFLLAVLDDLRNGRCLGQTTLALWEKKNRDSVRKLYKSNLQQRYRPLYERHTTPRALCSRSRLQADSRVSDRSGQSLYFGYARCVVIWLDETLEPHRCGFRSRLGQSRRVDRIWRELESTSPPSDARPPRHGPRFGARQRAPTWRRRASGGNRFSSRLCDGGRKEGRRQSVAYRICLCVRSDVAYWRCGGKLSRTERLPRAWIDGHLR